MGTLETIRAWARRVRRDATALWIACSHPNTPWYAKAMGGLVVAYALSPVDLIPDFIPVLGYLDEVVLLPVLIWLTVRLIPPDVLDESRRKAHDWIERRGSKPISVAGGVAIMAIWVVIAGALAVWAVEAFNR